MRKRQDFKINFLKKIQENKGESFFWCHNIQTNDTQPRDTYPNDTQPRNTYPNDNQNNDTQPNDN